MSIGPLGMIGSAAGTPLSQASGTDKDKATQDATDQARHAASTDKSEKAAGIGETEEQEQASDRDADGRRPWELNGEPQDASSPTPQRSKDASGQTGSQIDFDA